MPTSCRYTYTRHKPACRPTGCESAGQLHVSASFSIASAVKHGAFLWVGTSSGLNFRLVGMTRLGDADADVLIHAWLQDVFHATVGVLRRLLAPPANAVVAVAAAGGAHVRSWEAIHALLVRKLDMQHKYLERLEGVTLTRPCLPFYSKLLQTTEPFALQTARKCGTMPYVQTCHEIYI